LFTGVPLRLVPKSLKLRYLLCVEKRRNDSDLIAETKASASTSTSARNGFALAIWTRTVKPLVEQLGFEAVDAGPLTEARLLEPFAPSRRDHPEVARALARLRGGACMISKNLARRLERLEESLLPVLEEPIVIQIIAVDGDGSRTDGGMEFKIPAVPKPFKKRRW